MILSRSPSALPQMIGNKMEWLSKIPMPDADTEQLYRKEEPSDDSGNDGNDEESMENGLNEDAKSRRKSFASFASKTLSLYSPRKGSMDVSASEKSAKLIIIIYTRLFSEAKIFHILRSLISQRAKINHIFSLPGFPIDFVCKLRSGQYSRNPVRTGLEATQFHASSARSIAIVTSQPAQCAICTTHYMEQQWRLAVVDPSNLQVSTMTNLRIS